MKKILLSILAVAAMVALSKPAMADSVTQGGVVYTFTVLGQDSTSPNVWDVQMTVDLSGVEESSPFTSFAVQFTGATLVASEDMGGTSGLAALTFSLRLSCTSPHVERIRLVRRTGGCNCQLQHRHSSGKGDSACPPKSDRAHCNPNSPTPALRKARVSLREEVFADKMTTPGQF
jgi:hypothetical protein